MGSLVRPIPREAFQAFHRAFLYSPWSLRQQGGEILNALTSTGFYHDDLVPPPHQIIVAAKEHLQFCESASENLKEMARLREKAGLGTKGNPEGTESLSEEDRKTYLKTILIHLGQRESPVDIKTRSKRLDETSLEYENDETIRLGSLIQKGHKLSCGTIAAYRLLREASSLPEVFTFQRKIEEVKPIAAAYMAPGGLSVWNESMLNSCQRQDGLSCAARALAELIIKGKPLGKFNLCHDRDRDVILVTHPHLQEAYVFTSSQIEDFFGNISMVAAQDCLEAIIWPYCDFNSEQRHFPFLCTGRRFVAY